MKALWIVAALVAVLGGMWGYASYDIAERAHAYHTAVEELRFVQRGGDIMDEDTIYDRLESLGPPAGVQVLEMNVVIEDLDASNMDRAPTPTRIVSDAVGDDDSMEVTGTLIEIDVDIEASKWLWDSQEHVQIRRTVGEHVVMDR